MESIDYEQEEHLHSQNNKKEQKIKRFKQYLVQSHTIQNFVKFLFGLRSKQIADQGIPNKEALQLFKEYFGVLEPDQTEHNNIKQQISLEIQNGQKLKQQIVKIKQQIRCKKQQIQKAKEAKRLKQQQQAKNPKKAGKK